MMMMARQDSSVKGRMKRPVSTVGGWGVSARRKELPVVRTKSRMGLRSRTYLNRAKHGCLCLAFC